MTEKKPPIHILSYSGPLLVAVFKDFLDLTVILALPGIGTLLTVCAISLLWLLIFFFSRKKYHLQGNPFGIIRDFAILSPVFVLEGILFPFNLLPFLSGATFLLYQVDRRSYQKGK